MSPAVPPSDEIAELRRRLYEAEETLEAIRSGGVDSLVIGPPDNVQVYTLSTADQPYRLIVAAMGEGAATVAASGVILYANARLAEIAGRPIGELVGLPLRSLTDQAGQNVLRTLLAVPAGEIARGQLELARADGRAVPVTVAVSGVYLDASTFIHCLVVSDLTATREVEREIARTRDEALAAALLKSQFVAMVSHEIRTPMNGVIGLTNLLLENPLQPGPRRYAEAIRTSGQALLTIINDILDFSKIEAGKIELVDADFELDGLLEEIMHVAAETARDKDLEVLAYYPPDLPTTLRGDAGRLRQALLNLLSNAVKFTDHGEVQLRVEPTPAASDGRPRITFTVADTGIGIAAKDLPRLFQPFSQIDAATDREFGGTGLGLTITRQLVELMHGRLEVTSRPGRGSQFFFTIPVSAAQTPAARRQFKDKIAGRRILVVDDNPTTRHLITEHARAWGLAPTEAADGDTALDLLRRAAGDHHPYDVAVIDQHLRGMNGIELTEHINADPTISRVSVLLLTSGSNHDDQIAAAHRVDAMVAKPVGPSQLFNSLLQLLDPEIADAGQRGDAVPAHPVGQDRGLILLAEDNAINQMVAVDTLAMLGYQVDVARNGVEAIQLAGSKQYRAILMDCQMPGMDGYAATTEIRDHEEADQHIPIIAMTAGALAEDRQRCYAAGMDDYLAKPIDADQLQTALDRWIAETGTAEEHGARAIGG